MSAPAENPHWDRIERFRRKAGRVRDEFVVAAHGGGGKAMRDLIDDLIVRAFAGIATDEDQARFELAELSREGDRLAFTTDSFVVSPLRFPGGDIGSLAVNGTVNDLAVSGARPRYLSCGLILEEGLPIALLREVLQSMARAAEQAGVKIVTGDTKVVGPGAADQLFVNTAGVGVIPSGRDPRASALKADDVLLVNGTLGDHGAAILVARGELRLDVELASDCAPLNGLVEALYEAGCEVHALRDATRGGLAAVVNELALASEVGVVLEDRALPVRAPVRGVCEILGLDAVHMANEGKLVAAVPAAQAEQALTAWRAHPLGRDAAVIGRCRAKPAGLVTLDTGFGGERILDMVVGEQLPRIC